MRSRLAALLLVAVLLLMSALNLPAAPVPDPSAVLDIGLPPKGMTAKEYCKQVIDGLKHPIGALMRARFVPEVKKLFSTARLKEKEVGPWLERIFRIKEEDDGRRLRFTFRAGNRAEQVAIINAMLRCYMRDVSQEIKGHEDAFQPQAEQAVRFAKLAKEEQDPTKRAHWKESEENAKAVLERKKVALANVLAEIDRLKQIKVIKWAK